MKYNIIFSVFFTFWLCVMDVQAEQAWIIDDLRTGVQDGPSRNAGFAGTLVAGAPVEQLGKSQDGEYIHVRSGDIEGWVLARNVSETPSIRAQYEQQAQMLVEAQQQLGTLQNNDQTMSAQNQRLRAALSTAEAQAQQARDELLSLQRTAENVVEIDALNRELQNKIVTLEQENLRLTRQNTHYAEHNHSQQMIVGGGLVLGGMVLFWLLSLLGGARRRSSFNDF